MLSDKDCIESMVKVMHKYRACDSTVLSIKLYHVVTGQNRGHCSVRPHRDVRLHC